VNAVRKMKTHTTTSVLEPVLYPRHPLIVKMIEKEENRGCLSDRLMTGYFVEVEWNNMFKSLCVMRQKVLVVGQLRI
jgi:hypothetical protein